MRARDNPFSVERVQRIRYRLLDTTFEQLLSRLERMNYRAAIVGPEGSGKTTLLEDLAYALNQNGRRTGAVFVNDASPFRYADLRRLKAELIPGQILLVDGADALSKPLWFLLKRTAAAQASRLIVTSHAPGLLPTLIECTTNAQLFRDIVADLLPPGVEVDLPGLDRTYRRHRGNIRMALRELYDLYAAARTEDIVSNAVALPY